MKKGIYFAFVLVLTVSLALLSCDSKSEDDNAETIAGQTDTTDGYSFVGQTLQGKLGGISWTFISGKAELWSSTELWVDLYDYQPSGGDPCAIGAYDFNSDVIMFTDSNSVHLDELSWGSENSQSVTFYDGTTNNIALQGALEILSISATEVTGRMDATADNDNYANGNFSVTLCSSK